MKEWCLSGKWCEGRLPTNFSRSTRATSGGTSQLIVVAHALFSNREIKTKQIGTSESRERSRKVNEIFPTSWLIYYSI